MDEILKYFPNLTDIQKEQFEKLDFYTTIGTKKINVISRKTLTLYTKHILHL
jgi:16S rRNA (guanine527-N7)-methyltransferase